MDRNLAQKYGRPIDTLPQQDREQLKAIGQELRDMGVSAPKEASHQELGGMASPATPNSPGKSLIADYRGASNHNLAQRYGRQPSAEPAPEKQREEQKEPGG